MRSIDVFISWNETKGMYQSAAESTCAYADRFCEGYEEGIVRGKEKTVGTP